MKRPIIPLIIFLTLVVPGLIFSSIVRADTTPRIVGGNVAAENAYPFMARIYFFNASQNSFAPGCGGSIISERWILSAAHCFVNNTGATTPADDLRIVIGLNDLSNVPDNNIFRISRVVVHPNYQGNSNDIALLEMSSPTNIPPIQIPSRSSNIPLNNEVVTVAGWGAISEGGQQSSELKEVDLATVSNAECLPFYPRAFDGNVMVCARGNINGGEDSCQGDSGGPLFQERRGILVQTGIVSFGEGCARQRIPGVYARTTAFADWISSFVPDVMIFQSTDTVQPTDVTTTTTTQTNQVEEGSVLEGDAVVYEVTGAEQINLVTLTGDADLIIAEGSSFSDDSITCISEEFTPEDSCPVDSTASEVYAVVYGYETSNYAITAIFPGDTGTTTGGNPPPVIVTTTDTTSDPTLFDTGGTGSWDILALATLLFYTLFRRPFEGLLKKRLVCRRNRKCIV